MRRKGLITSLVTMFCLMTVSGAFAVSSYLTTFNSKYGMSATVLNTCGICHINPAGGGSRNPYGNAFAGVSTHSTNPTSAYTTIEPLDSDGDGYSNITEINARTSPGDATSHPSSSGDTTAPAVTVFTIPATSSTLAIPITTITATDNVSVTGYIVTQSSTKPTATAAGWSATAPKSYTVSAAGTYTLYAYAKDAAGNVSAGKSAAVTVSLSGGTDTTAPSVTVFTVPAKSGTLAIPVTTITATDNVSVTGYIVTQSSAKPSATATGWSATTPKSYTVSAAGTYTLYAYAKDATGNVSAGKSAAVTVSLSGGGTDTIAPIVTTFTIPNSYTALTVPISAFAVTDNIGVTGYMVTRSSTKPAATATGWKSSAPTSYTVSAAGTYTLYAYAKDAAGNVSVGKSSTVKVSLSGTSTTTISGVVRDIVTGAAISGVFVTDGTHSATTNSSGAYTISEAAGDHTLHVTKSGYLTTSQIASVVSGKTTKINWALTKSYGNQTIPAANMSYVILAWNDLGMHCDQNDYSYFMVLPPYNTLHAQIFKRGGEGAQLITSGVTVSYSFPKKKNSALHTNFWKYAAQYGFKVPTNVGITGTPLAGNMKLDAKGLGWQAVGIPITPYDDDGTWDPYGTAVITVKDSSGHVLQTANVVAPVSTEMMCSNCHGDGSGNQQSMQLSILQAHDAYNGTNLAANQAIGKVHSCSECHSDNALGAPGKPGIESLSLAMHNFHKDKMDTTPEAAAMSPGCYNCHPGPKTECLRGIMARAGKTCADCHGDMYGMTSDLLAGRQPWVDMPQCGDCHDAGHAENTDTLYRDSVLLNAPEDMGGKIYCEACHNGTHAEYTTSNPADPTIPAKFQGDNYWIWNCRVCHSSQTQGSMHRGIPGTSTSSTSSHD